VFEIVITALLVLVLLLQLHAWSRPSREPSIGSALEGGLERTQRLLRDDLDRSRSE